MWLCLNNAFLSIVAPKPADKAPAGTLLVRARRPGDIERTFPGCGRAETIDGRDYQFRAFISREIVANEIAASLRAITYTNFKNSVADHGLHDAYAGFWNIMARVQPQRPYSRYSERAVRRPQVQRGLSLGSKPAASTKPAVQSLGQLRDVLPAEFVCGEYDDTPAYKLRNANVVAKHKAEDKEWPGVHKNVHVWYVLDNGQAVAINENPSRGLSFPVIIVK